MTKLSIAILATCAAAAAAAQAPPTAAKAAHYYRLSFLISYPQGEHPAQSLVLDTPVSMDHPGMSEISSASGLIGQPDQVMQEKLSCTNVQRSATGISADVAFVEDRVTPAQAHSGGAAPEPIHAQRVFNRQVDLVLGKAMVITRPLHRMSLNHGVATPMLESNGSNDPAPAPQITVTATAL